MMPEKNGKKILHQLLGINQIEKLSILDTTNRETASLIVGVPVDIALVVDQESETGV